MMRSDRSGDELRLQRIVGGHVLAAAFVLLGISAAAVARDCRRLRSPAAGMPAPDFSLPTTNSEVVRLTALRGQVVLVDFWASWCAPCLRKFPLLKQLQRDLGAQGLRVLAINTEGDPARVRRFVHEQGLDQPERQHSITTLLDDGSATAAYGVHTIPHVVVIDRQGKIVTLHIGAGGQQALRDGVQSALAAPRAQDRQGGQHER